MSREAWGRNVLRCLQMIRFLLPPQLLSYDSSSSAIRCPYVGDHLGKHILLPGPVGIYRSN